MFCFYSYLLLKIFPHTFDRHNTTYTILDSQLKKKYGKRYDGVYDQHVQDQTFKYSAIQAIRATIPITSIVLGSDERGVTYVQT
jgi:hypothetical protein